MREISSIMTSLVLLIIFFYIIKGSAKILGKLVTNGIIGLVSLFIFNLFGGIIGLNIEITAFNAIIAGFLGIPGIIILLLINM